MHRRVVPLFGLLLALCGCGGDTDGVGCTADIAYVPKAAYAGSYTAAFTPTGASAPSLSFALTLDASGVAVGAVTQSGATASVAGTGADVRNGCTTSTTGFELAFTPGDGQARVLSATKIRNGSIPGSYVGGLTTTADGATTAGILVVAERLTP